jgi:hypothetical protein
MRSRVIVVATVSALAASTVSTGAMARGGGFGGGFGGSHGGSFGGSGSLEGGHAAFDGVGGHDGGFGAGHATALVGVHDFAVRGTPFGEHGIAMNDEQSVGAPHSRVLHRMWGYGHPYGDCDDPYDHPYRTNNDDCDY